MSPVTERALRLVAPARRDVVPSQIATPAITALAASCNPVGREKITTSQTNASIG